MLQGWQVFAVGWKKTFLRGKNAPAEIVFASFSLEKAGFCHYLVKEKSQSKVFLQVQKKSEILF